MVIENLTLFDFNKDSNLDNWYVVDDVVMGGVSNGSLSIDEYGHGVFSGEVSLENNGGFSSLRHIMQPIDVSGYETALLRVKGDGKKYQFRVRSGRREYYSYIANFKTTGEWETIEIPLEEMYPSFRGRRLDLPKYSKKRLEEITILISNKKNESFELLIDHIDLK